MFNEFDVFLAFKISSEVDMALKDIFSQVGTTFPASAQSFWRLTPYIWKT
jgi:hypothetical protein